MICPRCGIGRMILHRVEHRFDEVVYIYKCEKCGYKLEVAYKKKIDNMSFWPKPKPKQPKPYMTTAKPIR